MNHARRRDVRLAAGAAWLATLLATILQPPASRFVYDALYYWSGSVAVAHGQRAYDVGLLHLRGAMSPVLYLPAALVVRLTDDSAAGFAVLFENGILVATLGALLLPRLIASWQPVTPATIWASAGLTWLFVAPFAPYPLSDLWTAVLFIGAIVAISSNVRFALVVGGLAAGFALNIRPAYLLPVASICVLVAMWRRLGSLWFLAGVAVALLPQSIVNLAHGSGWKPWPPRTGSDVLETQTQLAPFVTRYDTIVTAQKLDPRQFWCSPDMARALDRPLPSSPVDLAVTYLRELPLSGLYLAEKIGAAVHWPVSVPYFAPAYAVNGLFALATTFVFVVGAAALLRSFIRQRGNPRCLGIWLVGVTWLTCLATLTNTATETRFALPLVLFGIAGCASLVTTGPSVRTWRAERVWVASAILLSLVVFQLGSMGLSHPAPRGDATAATCAAT